jgi:hypothetical protein
MSEVAVAVEVAVAARSVAAPSAAAQSALALPAALAVPSAAAAHRGALAACAKFPRLGNDRQNLTYRDAGSPDDQRISVGPVEALVTLAL